ncbi:S-adenosyl-L-methionine-dependent methyltransferase [Ephemerocybe angulata]|uniref:S-adenosyl-L-methionine-dependent methyltransferase n=1 Tax=Ephemerocybe angulata TaxID=980116 RepID=A0A8H6M7L4_9AGAR|nr:S-adenosyl-L-methionine-dependent methyltransferase [Tulosesus angulatus]
MASQGEYIIGYKPPQIQHHAARTAENSAQYLLPRLTKLAEAKPNLQLLDIGAGPGTISASLAKYLPQGTVTATDISTDVLAQAKAHAESVGSANVVFQMADAYALPFEDASFDVVHVSQVLGHLGDPVRALREMLRADIRSWVAHPDLKGVRETMEIMGGMMPRRDTGMRLVEFAMGAGVGRGAVEFGASVQGFYTLEERRVFGGACRERVREGAVGKRALQVGSHTQEELDGIVKAWDEWIEREDAGVACINGEILITKEESV